MTTSKATRNLKQSGIRAASTRCKAIGGINLGQGVCDIPVEASIKQGVFKAVTDDKSTYSPCEGIYPLREKIAEKMQAFNKVNYDPQTEVMVTSGSTGAFVCAVTTLFEPGDEIILFEPFYGYHKNILELKGMTVKSVSLDLQDLSFDLNELKANISEKTKGIVVCTPNNPTGKVYSKAELLAIGELAKAHNLWILTDEIYEYITYDGYEHISMASLLDHKTRTITISGLSKTFNMTGWRLGYACGPAKIIEKMVLVQDLVYVCPATPLQYAAIAALELPQSYYNSMQEHYTKKRALVVNGLNDLGFKVTMPQGAYYLLANVTGLGFEDDVTATDALLEHAKVATVPGRNFYNDPAKGHEIIRFCYALAEGKLQQALKAIEMSLEGRKLKI